MENTTNNIATASGNSSKTSDSAGVQIPDFVAKKNDPAARAVYAMAYRKFTQGKKLDFVAPAHRYTIAKAYHAATTHNRRRFGIEARPAYAQ